MAGFLAALAAFLAVIFAAYWLLKRYGGKWGIGPAGRGGMLRLLAHLSLGPRKSIVVVRFMHKNLVLGVTEHNITLLTEETADDDDTTAPNSFAATLAARARTPDGDGAPPAP